MWPPEQTQMSDTVGVGSAWLSLPVSQGKLSCGRGQRKMRSQSLWSKQNNSVCLRGCSVALKVQLWVHLTSGGIYSWYYLHNVTHTRSHVSHVTVQSEMWAMPFASCVFLLPNQHFNRNNSNYLHLRVSFDAICPWLYFITWLFMIALILVWEFIHPSIHLLLTADPHQGHGGVVGVTRSEVVTGHQFITGHTFYLLTYPEHSMAFFHDTF